MQIGRQSRLSELAVSSRWRLQFNRGGIVEELDNVVRLLKENGFTIVLVEQNFHFASPLADRILVFEHGTVVAEVQADELVERQSVQKEFLGI